MAVNLYDQLAFESHPSPERHLDRFALLGHLFGLHSASPASARVLEIGCARGGGLIPLAWQFPQSKFLGIDPSSAQIQQAKDFAAEVKLSNIQFACSRIEDWDFGEQKFDYIICHGVFSWVDNITQRALLEKISAGLAEQGLAYLSYNVLPGWSIRGQLRDELSSVIKREGSVEEQASTVRTFLSNKRDSIAGQLDHQSIAVKEEIDACLKRSDAFLLHELLNEDCHSMYFSDFATQLQAVDVQFMCEANPDRSHQASFPRFRLSGVGDEEIRYPLSKVQREQNKDSQSNVSLRGSLICRGKVSLREALELKDIRSCFVSSSLMPEVERPDIRSHDALVFHTARGLAFHVTDPWVKAGLLFLRATWPVPVSFVELGERSFQLYRGSDSDSPSESEEEKFALAFFEMFKKNRVELHFQALPCTRYLGRKPRVSPVVAAELKRRDWVTTLRYEYFVLGPLSRLVCEALNGERTTDQVVEHVLKAIRAGKIFPKEDGKQVTDLVRLREIVVQEVKQVFGDLAEHALLLTDTSEEE